MDEWDGGLIRFLVVTGAVYVFWSYLAGSGTLWSNLDTPAKLIRLGFAGLVLCFVEGPLEAWFYSHTEVAPRTFLALGAIILCAAGYAWQQIRNLRRKRSHDDRGIRHPDPPQG